MECPKCKHNFESNHEDIINEIISTVEGRKLIRKVLGQTDNRVRTRIPKSDIDTKSGILSKVIKRFIELRSKACLTQSVIANELGVSSWTVHRWELSGKGPGIDLCEKWANILGTNLKDILESFEDA